MTNVAQRIIAAVFVLALLVLLFGSLLGNIDTLRGNATAYFGSMSSLSVGLVAVPLLFVVMFLYFVMKR